MPWKPPESDRWKLAECAEFLRMTQDGARQFLERSPVKKLRIGPRLVRYWGPDVIALEQQVPTPGTADQFEPVRRPRPVRARAGADTRTEEEKYPYLYEK